MAKILKEKKNKISDLLSEHKFTIVNGINDDYKCGICKNIINNAHQAICGCNFCLECINRFIENGGIKCPGDTDECKYENLLNLVPNYQKNIQISKMIVKCLNENCYHECKLIEMEDHLRFCSMKKVKCLFNDIGCEYKEMANDKLNEHFTLNVVSHSKILVELIDHLRNEVRELKKSDTRNSSEIEILKANNNKKDESIESLRHVITSKIMLITNDTNKDEVIELLQTEIKSIKQENQELKALLKNSNNNLWRKIDEINMEINDKCGKEAIKSLNDRMELMEALNVNLRLNDTRNQEENKMFISNEKKKNETIEYLMNEINSKNAILTPNDNKINVSIETLSIKIDSIKQENQELKTSMKNSINNLRKKLDEFDIELKDRCKNETIKSIKDQIELAKIDKIELTNQLKVFKKYFQEMDDNNNHKLEIDQPKELKFKGPFTSVVTGDINLKNAGNKSLYFKVLTTAPKMYCVRPNSGLIEPSEKINVLVMLQPFNFNPNEKSKHNFLIQSMVADEKNLEWKSVDKNLIKEIKIRCVLDN